MCAFLQSEVVNDFFSLSLHHKEATTNIEMQVYSSFFSTAALPNTYKILKTHLPTIHLSSCVNEKNLPFSQEVRHTEIGHLFEHILLEYVYQKKEALGQKNILVQGETSWNWLQKPRGFFTIVVNVGVEEMDILQQALSPTIQLLQFIFASHMQESFCLKQSPALFQTQMQAPFKTKN